MRTEQEIRNKIRWWEEIRDTAPPDAFDLIMEAERAIATLMWTLNETYVFQEEYQ